MSALIDACLACFPGDAPAATPENLTADASGFVTADYQCALCGLTWTTKWKVTSAFPEVRVYRASIPLLDKAIDLLVSLLDGEELEPV